MHPTPTAPTLWIFKSSHLINSKGFGVATSIRCAATSTSVTMEYSASDRAMKGSNAPVPLKWESEVRVLWKRALGPTATVCVLKPCVDRMCSHKTPSAFTEQWRSLTKWCSFLQALLVVSGGSGLQVVIPWYSMHLLQVSPPSCWQSATKASSLSAFILQVAFRPKNMRVEEAQLAPLCKGLAAAPRSKMQGDAMRCWRTSNQTNHHHHHDYYYCSCCYWCYFCCYYYYDDDYDYGGGNGPKMHKEPAFFAPLMAVVLAASRLAIFYIKLLQV